MSESKAEALSLLGKQEYFFSIVIQDKWNKREKNDINNAMMITSKQTNAERHQHMNHSISGSERDRDRERCYAKLLRAYVRIWEATGSSVSG